jgi:hypothetical protein
MNNAENEERILSEVFGLDWSELRKVEDMLRLYTSGSSWHPQFRCEEVNSARGNVR